MCPARFPSLPLDISALKPGLRLAVGLSGGADSVALLRALHQQRAELGLVLSAAHLHHGLRGEEASADREFARNLARELGVPFHTEQVDVAAAAKKAEGKEAESLEEAARRLRYGWFRQLMAMGEVDAVATAHTRDDQAETVLAKLLRGAWTEGLSGIQPQIEHPEGRIVRPLLATARAEVESFLKELGQSWREDSSNRDPSFTRNRIRHELMPALEKWNPQLRPHLAQMAELARDEEEWWRAQLAWLAPQLLLPGKAARGGGREGGGVALDARTLAKQPVAMQRRLLRYAAEHVGAILDFPSTEALRALALTGRAGQKRELANGLRAERTHREVRLRVENLLAEEEAGNTAEVAATAPGELQGFGLRLRIDADAAEFTGQRALLRRWKAGDRVTPRYSSGPRKVKEVLERLRVNGSGRQDWPVLEVAGRIVWMKDVELEPVAGISVTASPLNDEA